MFFPFSWLWKRRDVPGVVEGLGEVVLNSGKSRIINKSRFIIRKTVEKQLAYAALFPVLAKQRKVVNPVFFTVFDTLSWTHFGLIISKSGCNRLGSRSRAHKWIFP